MTGGTFTGDTYVGTTSDPTDKRIGVRSKSGGIRFWASGSATGEKGIWITNNAGTSTQVMGVDQNNTATFSGNAFGSLHSNGMVYKGLWGSAKPLSQIHESGYWYCTGENYPSDAPETAKYGYIINYHFDGLNYDYQIFVVSYNGVSARYERRYNNGSWGTGWKKVTYTTV